MDDQFGFIFSFEKAEVTYGTGIGEKILHSIFEIKNKELPLFRNYKEAQRRKFAFICVLFWLHPGRNNVLPECLDSGEFRFFIYLCVEMEYRPYRRDVCVSKQCGMQFFGRCLCIAVTPRSIHI